MRDLLVPIDRVPAQEVREPGPPRTRLSSPGIETGYFFVSTYASIVGVTDGEVDSQIR